MRYERWEEPPTKLAIKTVLIFNYILYITGKFSWGFGV